jgi:hypothetical protein
VGLKGFSNGQRVEVLGIKDRSRFWYPATIMGRHLLSTKEGRRSYLYTVQFEDGLRIDGISSEILRKPDDPVELRRLATIARLKRKTKKKVKPLRAHDLKGSL